jgi:hypothetical protein
MHLRANVEHAALLQIQSSRIPIELLFELLEQHLE